MNNKVCIGLIGFLFLAGSAFADAKKQQERVENSGKVVKEILDVPDNVPQDFLDKAKRRVSPKSRNRTYGFCRRLLR